MEPFPAVEDAHGYPSCTTNPSDSNRDPQRSNTVSSITSCSLQSASLRFLVSNPPTGMWMATGDIISRAPTLKEIRTGCFSTDGWTEEGQLEWRGSTPHDIQRRKLSRANTLAACAFSASAARDSALGPRNTQLDGLREHETQLRRTSTDPVRNLDLYRISEMGPKQQLQQLQQVGFGKAGGSADAIDAKKESPQEMGKPTLSDTPSSAPPVPDVAGRYPQRLSLPTETHMETSHSNRPKGFWQFHNNPLRFLRYNLRPQHRCMGCNDILPPCSMPRRQCILNALFCVTGFGLIPWRFRDFCYLLQWRLMNSHTALRKLAGIHRAWFRLANSDKLPDDVGPPPVYSSSPSSTTNNNSIPMHNLSELQSNPALPLPPSSIPPAPLTGARAPPTKPYLLDLLVWMYVINTALQACLAGIMWGFNRFTRPSWAVGFLVAAGSLTGMVAGGITFWEGKRVKMVEGVPVEMVENEDEEAGAAGERRRGGEQNSFERRKKLARRRTKSWKRQANWYRRI
ncbi:hypothetical protein PAAG_06942 [Paracoccidioides lutzii Pb01]|uniref:Uncharacterized protein n=1 Tax=Paracoccidioides lutzii (strain ATCC MYA-826 / Pb01) TaxID=502779 RepID=C1H8E6_PARBA|nr:hypothetical protein PAAG_06942 [Paracoccidioides lutzii Pb01]EEH36524.2 hypothetical protein PAAG_06942 [Paracoccidioides lutzii Pb01]